MNYLIGLVKAHITMISIALTAMVVTGFIVFSLVAQSNLDEEISILDAGLDTVPIIKNDDLQELGKLYSTLNSKFEREIDALVKSKPTRNNKKNGSLTHYGVYGKENKDPFKNNDYTNGVTYKYEKATSSIPDKKNNFNDIIAVMSVLYDQKMDTISTSELKDVFSELFQMSHTFTYDTSELYPCKSGCDGVKKYKCTDVYNDYKSTDLKYDPFTVKKSSLYEDKGYEEDTDFRMVYPAGQCIVCGTRGAGCILTDKTCYHSSSNIVFSQYDNIQIDGKVYRELGDTIDIDEQISEEFKGDPDAPSGKKLARTDTKCRYYKIVKECNTRKNIANKIVSLKNKIANERKKIEKENESFSKKKNPSEAAYKSHDKKIERYEANIEKYEAQVEEQEELLQIHIETVCEKDENAAMFWCNGFKVCLGHKNHYMCPSHKLVCCFGHTTVNLTVKILYKDELLDLCYKTFK